MKLFITAILSLSLVSVAGCGKSDKDDKSGTNANAKGASKGAKASNASKGGSLAALGSLGIKAELPKGAKVGKAIVGAGVLIQGPGLVVGVELATDSHGKTIEEAKSNADMYTPKKIKTEKLADGWVFTFENKGGMGTNYWVKVRRTIGGKDYWCSTSVSRPDQQANAVKLCKSLK